MGALDHFLNGLNAVLKASDRADAAKAAEKASAQRSAVRNERKLTRGSFGAAPASNDLSCCLAKRKIER